MPVDADGRAAGTQAVVLQADIGLSTGFVQVPGATRKATGGEDPSVPGASRGVDHQGNFHLLSGAVITARFDILY